MLKRTSLESSSNIIDTLDWKLKTLDEKLVPKDIALADYIALGIGNLEKDLDELFKKYEIRECEVLYRSEELAEGDYRSLENLTYFAHDIAIDNFKMALIEHIENNDLQKETGISCISQMNINIIDGEIEEKYVSFDLMDYSVENYNKFLECNKSSLSE